MNVSNTFFKYPLFSDQYLQNFPFNTLVLSFSSISPIPKHSILLAAKEVSKFLTQNKTQRILSLI